MSFLLAKILFQLLIAAVLGAVLAYWWVRRSYEDVTREYALISDDLQTWRQGFEDQLARRPDGDAATLGARLERVETAIQGLVIRPTNPIDLAPLLAKLDALEARLAAAPPAVPVAASPPVPASPPTPEPETAIIREGSRNLLAHAAFGRPDDLKQIRGVATVLEGMLHDIGVYYFWQIAEWTPGDVHHADAQLTAFKGRIERDAWVEQARSLAAAPGAARKPDRREA